jgi:hypothetical protein
LQIGRDIVRNQTVGVNIGAQGESAKRGEAELCAGVRKHEEGGKMEGYGVIVPLPNVYQLI